MQFSGQPLDVFSLLSSLKSYRLIITDTYHLCLNAWRAGIPAICITDGNEMAPASLSDKKKEVFYLTYGAQDLLIDTDSLKQSTTIKYLLPWAKDCNELLVDQLASIALNESLANSVRKNIRQQKLSVESAFISTLNSLIA